MDAKKVGRGVLILGLFYLLAAPFLILIPGLESKNSLALAWLLKGSVVFGVGLTAVGLHLLSRNAGGGA